MTVYIASLFLPYTIDFKATELRRARRTSSTSSHHSTPDNGVIGRLAEARQRGHKQSVSLSRTPGATTDDEKIFKPYVSRSASEIPQADDPNGPGLSEPRTIPWGQSRKFNQPRSTAQIHLTPSILSRPEGGDESTNQFQNDALPPTPDSEEDHGPRALLLVDDWVVKAAEQGNGGLRNGVYAAEEAGILTDKMWVGTLGMPTDLLKEDTRASISETLQDEYESIAVFVGDNEFEGHYTHFCRAVLWPAFHYQMQESPRHTEYDDYSWKQYVKVNEAYANTIAARWRPGDSIWVHDYHLLLLPGMLRERIPQAEIGFFMHAAFPSSEVFRCLNPRNALLSGLLGSDFIGFQTDEYCHHFLQTCSRLLSLEVTVDGVQLQDRFVRVKSIPIGTDVKALDDLRQTPEVKDWIASIMSRYSGKHLIVARDRLDAPGGIKQKLLAYELFLKKYPKWRENVVLIQIASASEMPELESQVSKVATRINSKYSSLTHQPLVLLSQDISYSQFLALMSVAEIFMVTSLREGMNLTCHDYLHCQDGKVTSQTHGSLILSEFTGSASIFSGHEFLVNPWDYREVADAINKALEISPEEKQQNWEFLLERKAPHSAIAWCDSFRTTLSEAYSAQLSRELSLISTLSVPSLKESYEAAGLRLFFLEDDGTVGPAIPDSLETMSVLEPLLQDPKNRVYITSNKSPEQLEARFEAVSDRIGYIAENGCFKREIGSTQWKPLVDMERAKEWRSGIRRVIQYYQERTDGSVMEERRCLLTFWYDQAHDPEIAARQASDLADQLNGTRGNEAIRVVLTEGTVSVEPLDVTKAKAAESVIESLPQTPDFLFVAGGSRGDEALFRWANRLLAEEKVPHITTVTVGVHATEATAVLPAGMGIADVVGDLISAPASVNGHTPVMNGDDAAIVEGEPPKIVNGEDAAIVEADDSKIVKGEDAAIVEGENSTIVHAEDAAIVEGEPPKIVNGEDAAIAEADNSTIVNGDEAVIVEKEDATIPNTENAMIANGEPLTNGQTSKIEETSTIAHREEDLIPTASS